jgi:hypothetical protein
MASYDSISLDRILGILKSLPVGGVMVSITRDMVEKSRPYVHFISRQPADPALDGYIYCSGPNRNIHDGYCSPPRDAYYRTYLHLSVIFE